MSPYLFIIVQCCDTDIVIIHLANYLKLKAFLLTILDITAILDLMAILGFKHALIKKILS